MTEKELMEKEAILSEIRRITEESGGRAPGVQAFRTVTGIGEHRWKGKYWRNWGDAVREAGFAPNAKAQPYPEDALLQHLIDLIRHVRSFPVEADYDLYRGKNASFPSRRAFRRLGGKAARLARVIEYCQKHPDCQDARETCEAANSAVETTIVETPHTPGADGFVYLLKCGRYYKIGKTNAVGRRERELAIQLPERSRRVHAIRTDDPAGIERYWHARFGDRRVRPDAEWFDLSPGDVSAFRRRSFR